MKLDYGVVEDVNDPLMLGRVRVRVFGYHSDDKSLIPTNALPWAQIMQPTTSASISGIGFSPSGLVQGSWVIVSFIDKDCQYPLILGSFHGIPTDAINQSPAIEQTDFVLPDSTNSVVKDSSGNVLPPSNNTSTTPAVDLNTVQLTGARRASDFTSVTTDCVNLIKTSEKFSANAYLDTNGKWTIGYGTQAINGIAVVQGQTITEPAAAAALMVDINATRLPAVQKMVTVLVTQSMIDALVDFAFNLGNGALRKSTLLSDLNAEKYTSAATRFGDYTMAGGKVLQGLVNRRAADRDLFLKDGIPTPTGELQQLEKNPDPVSQTVTTDSSGNTNTTTTVNTNAVKSQRGFTDPSGKYPLYYQEPDTNRLSRNQNISNTIVYRKEAALDQGVAIANGDTWDQSPVPYNAKYPFNKVLATETGHLMEFDDTENSRRIHLYHAAGTFTEIDDNGTQVNRIVGDGFEILERNGYVHVKGALNVNVEGAKTLKVGNTLDLEVSGATTINVYNDVNLNVSGNSNTSVGGNAYLYASNGTVAVDATAIYLNTGIATGLAQPQPVQTPDPQTFSELHVVTRGEESAMQYETPDEGDSSQYNANRLEAGEVTKQDITSTPDVQSTTEVSSTTAVAPIATDCGTIHNMTDWPANLVLSTYFTIGDLNKNGQRKIIAQSGLQPGDIACNLKMLCLNVLDIIKKNYPNMIITSGFRRPGDAANSSATSQHYTGQAVDIQIPGYSKQDYINAVNNIQSLVPYDQLLLEYEGQTTTWIHVSYSTTNNRRQIFTMFNHKRISNFGEIKLA